MSQDKKPAFALIIVAHPDDESFLFAGTSLKLAEEGKRVEVVCATKGEKGADRLNRNLTEQEMAEIRVSELKRACNILKCGCSDFFDYPDGGLDKVDFEKLVDNLAQKIEQCQPEIILTFGTEGISGHRDHIIIGQAVMAAAKKAEHRIAEIWLASMPRSEIKKFNEHLTHRKVHYTHFQEKELQGVADEKLLKIDIQKYSMQKHEALKAHESQYLPQFVLDTFLKYEYFEIIKLGP